MRNGKLLFSCVGAFVLFTLSTGCQEQSDMDFNDVEATHRVESSLIGSGAVAENSANALELSTLKSCGGIAGVGCPDGLWCVDDPTDNCDTQSGGADCGGLCVSPEDRCGSVTSDSARSEPIAFGEIMIPTYGCTPVCDAIGSRSEGWYDGCTGELIRYDFCKDTAAFCDKIGSKSEGWYTNKGELIRWDSCSRPNPANPARSFVFDGRRGQTIDLYLDGLLERQGLRGLDTVACLRLGQVPIAANDDTASSGWRLRLNQTPNGRSSSINAFKLPANGRYTVVTRTKAFQQGSAELVIKTSLPHFCAVATVTPTAHDSTYVYAKNFSDTDAAKSWLDGFRSLASGVVEEGRCNDPRPCYLLHKPVCGVIRSEPQKNYSNACVFRSAVMTDAGGESPLASKGYFQPGECSETPSAE